MIVDTLHVFWDTQHKYRWSFVSENGRVLVDCAQGYADRRDALHGFEILNRTHVRGPAIYRLERCERHGSRSCLVWQIVRIDQEAAIADALRLITLTCPVHGIPDCSPILNGCRIPEYLRNQLDEHARLHDQRSQTR